MKQGGVSYNAGPKHKGGIQTRFKCSICGREYKQDYTKNRHQKLCIEKENSMKGGNEENERY